MLALAVLLVLLGAFGIRAQRRELESAAETDPLTGLHNRRRLLADLERRAARRLGAPGVLALFDLDGFKSYNDTFGHLAGDALLQRLGGRLRRDGGRRTAPRLPARRRRVLRARRRDARRRRAQRAAEAARCASRARLRRSRARIGGVAIPSEATTPTEALRLADQRMYAHKSTRARSPSASPATC